MIGSEHSKAPQDVPDSDRDEDKPKPELVRRDEAQTERQAPDNAQPGEAAG